MKRLLLVLMVVVTYVLHQDFWFWRAARPFVFGFLPIGLFYHVCYTLAVAVVMWLLVKHAWPSHLEKSGQDSRLQSEMAEMAEMGNLQRNLQSGGRS